MKITFWGAAQNVTGSKHLIEIENYKLLLDCGFYQGKRTDANQRNSVLPFDAVQIDAVILSHAHLDHCGTLPVLVKNGFAGKIYCTNATAEIAKFILLDSASIQEQDAEYLNKHIQNETNLIAPIYTKEDVEKTLEHFETVDYFRNNQQWKILNENIRFKFYDAGHILGSAITLIEIKENGTVKNLVFTGDLGRSESPILKSPEKVLEKAEIVLLECTYGSRTHKPIGQAIDQLKAIINNAIKTSSKIIVPAFALGRIQELIYIIHKLIDQKEIAEIPIYIDSPLANNITEVFSKYSKDFDEDFWKDFGNSGEDPFMEKNIKYVRTVEESKSLNDKAGPFVVIAASGMAEGGRILHHLKNNIGDENNVVLLTGYQAENTLGRRLQDKITPVKIYGEFYDVKAKIISLSELSAHADENGLKNYIKSVDGAKNIFLVHTEIDTASTFKKDIEKDMPSATIDIPTMGQSNNFL